MTLFTDGHVPNPFNFARVKDKLLAMISCFNLLHKLTEYWFFHKGDRVLVEHDFQGLDLKLRPTDGRSVLLFVLVCNLIFA